MIEVVPCPRIVACAYGGYLAVSPRQARFQIGVTAQRRVVVEYKYWKTYIEWCETLPLETAPSWRYEMPAKRSVQKLNAETPSYLELRFSAERPHPIWDR